MHSGHRQSVGVQGRVERRSGSVAGLALTLE
jgi:hypothetical protein